MDYKNLKVLSIQDFYFKLPADFNGSLSDAFRLYADYHDKIKNTDKHTNDPVKKGINVWNEFLDVIEGGRKSIGILSINEFEDDGTPGGKMKIMKDFDTK